MAEMRIPVPDHIAWLVEAVGEQSALMFIESQAGRRLWVPKAPNDNFAAIVGDDVAEAITMQFGGEYWDVPICRHWRVRHLYCQGLSHSDIAFRVGCDRSNVKKILAARTRHEVEARRHYLADDRQATLF